ncbi:MAG TPA: DUF2199 domain-containing protein [Polyangiales bacterium]|nr:DUF2199 domain-containing protein [Polyangiales bacterium]
MSSPIRGEFRFKCSMCTEWHYGLPDLGFDAPYHYASLSDHERKSIARKTDDLCAIEERDFFIRGVLELPIIGRDDRFGIGVWVSLKRENFERYVELFDDPDRTNHGPYFGWLCNKISGYPDTLELKTMVHLRPTPERPAIMLEPSDHPLAIQQRDGIPIEDILALIEPTLHPRNEA